MDQVACGFCGELHPTDRLVAGRSTHICSGCVGLGLVATIASAASGPELPEADALCSFCANRPQALEVALTARPGRIDQAIEFPLPDAVGRLKLARLYGCGVDLSDETLDYVAERTDGVSAAFLKELMQRSTQFALERGEERVGREDVDAALNELLFAGGRLNAALLGAVGAFSSGS